MKKAIMAYNNGLAINSDKRAIEQKINPIETLDAMTEAIRLVGDAFGRGELWLPDLLEQRV